jgi:predicted nucleotide-binding protein (sugar kinase/HSP70/actin superfamily)
LGKKLKKNKEEIEKAIENSIKKEKEIKEKEKKEFFEKIRSKKKKIVLVSHPYNLYDEYVNLRMEEKLVKLGVQPIFVNEIPISKSKIPNPEWPRFHWEFGKEIMERVDDVLKYKIDGAIQISSFACGCDAVLKEFVEKRFKENKPRTIFKRDGSGKIISQEMVRGKIPFLYLIIDEHTGEAGFQTRLEAFIDTLQ